MFILMIVTNYYTMSEARRKISFAQFSSESSWVNKNCIHFEKKSLILKTVQGVQTSFEVKKYRQNDEFSHFPGTDQYSKAHKS